VTATKKRTTYRLTPDLDKKIAEEAAKMGVSKNAFVQITLTRALKHNNDTIRPTGTE